MTAKRDRAGGPQRCPPQQRRRLRTLTRVVKPRRPPPRGPRNRHTALLPAEGGPPQDEPERDGPAAAPPAEAALPAVPEVAEEDADAALSAAAERAGGEPDDGDLRTGEVVARIWIAPFVDGNGVYREASHVRVVLEPAGWRLR